MKTTRIIALALALVTATALVACNNTADDETTTTAATTTQSTTKKPDTNKPSTEEPTGPVAETPATGADVATMLTGTNLQSIITDANLTGMTPYGDAEGLDKLFNGTIVGDKLGGNVSGTAEITWKTSVASTVKSYIVYTGNDSADYGRLPYAWEFSGSNDDGATWTVIDKVEISGVTKSNNAPFGYTVDAPAAYTSYKFAISACSDDGVNSGSTALQMNELTLIGEAEGVSNPAETPVTDAAEIDTMIAGGTNLQSTVTEPTYGAPVVWGDGKAEFAFDGDTTGTKLGGGDIAGAVEIAWTTNVATTVKNYIIYTGLDSEKEGRTPMAWVLYGSADGETWNVIDVVANSGMVNSNSAPYGYTVDAPAAYTSYKLVVTAATDNTGNWVAEGSKYALQFNELVLIGDAAAAE